jgi:hypothetical protein
MKLLAALGASLRYDRSTMLAFTADGASKIDLEAVWTEALVIAKQLDDADYQLRAISGLRVVHLSDGNLREVLALARKFKEVAARATDPRDPLAGDRMIGYALHLLGEQAQARQHIETMLRSYVTSVHRWHIIRFGYDQRVLANNTLATILWLQGKPDQAVRVADGNVDYARTLDHELSLCNALAQSACPLALRVGDLAAAERYIAMLLDHSARHALALWHATGRYLDAVLRSEQGETVTRFLRTALDEIHEASFETRYLPLLTALAEMFCKAGEIATGRSTIDQAIERCRQSEELWYLPELLRVSGEIVLQEGAAPEEAELQFLQALDLARRQEVPSWELRAATSLARLWRNLGRPGDARAQLASVYDRFTEGFETADLRRAKQLLDDLGRELGRPD